VTDDPAQPHRQALEGAATILEAYAREVPRRAPGNTPVPTHEHIATELRHVFCDLMDRRMPDVFGLHEFEHAVEEIVRGTVDRIAQLYGNPNQWLLSAVRVLADRHDHRSRMLVRRLSELGLTPRWLNPR
jgi:hypothetical protein